MTLESEETKVPGAGDIEDVDDGHPIPEWRIPWKEVFGRQMRKKGPEPSRTKPPTPAKPPGDEGQVTHQKRNWNEWFEKKNLNIKKSPDQVTPAESSETEITGGQVLLSVGNSVYNIAEAGASALYNLGYSIYDGTRSVIFYTDQFNRDVFGTYYPESIQHGMDWTYDKIMGYPSSLTSEDLDNIRTNNSNRWSKALYTNKANNQIKQIEVLVDSDTNYLKNRNKMCDIWVSDQSSKIKSRSNLDKQELKKSAQKLIDPETSSSWELPTTYMDRDVCMVLDCDSEYKNSYERQGLRHSEQVSKIRLEYDQKLIEALADQKQKIEAESVGKCDTKLETLKAEMEQEQFTKCASKEIVISMSGSSYETESAPGPWSKQPYTDFYNSNPQFKEPESSSSGVVINRGYDSTSPREPVPVPKQVPAPEPIPIVKFEDSPIGRMLQYGKADTLTVLGNLLLFPCRLVDRRAAFWDNQAPNVLIRGVTSGILLVLYFAIAFYIAILIPIILDQLMDKGGKGVKLLIRTVNSSFEKLKNGDYLPERFKTTETETETEEEKIKRIKRERKEERKIERKNRPQTSNPKEFIQRRIGDALVDFLDSVQPVNLAQALSGGLVLKTTASLLLIPPKKNPLISKFGFPTSDQCVALGNNDVTFTYVYAAKIVENIERTVSSDIVKPKARKNTPITNKKIAEKRTISNRQKHIADKLSYSAGALALGMGVTTAVIPNQQEMIVHERDDNYLNSDEVNSDEVNTEGYRVNLGSGGALFLPKARKTPEQQAQAFKDYEDLLGPEFCEKLLGQEIESKPQSSKGDKTFTRSKANKAKSKVKSKHARKKAKMVGLKDLPPLNENDFENEAYLTDSSPNDTIKLPKIKNK